MQQHIDALKSRLLAAIARGDRFVAPCYWLRCSVFEPNLDMLSMVEQIYMLLHELEKLTLEWLN